MKYGVQLIKSENGNVTGISNIVYESNIITFFPGDLSNSKAIDLRKEILNNYEGELISDILPLHQFLQKYRIKADNFDEIKKEWDEAAQTKELKLESYKYNTLDCINFIEQLRDYAEENELLDSQEYLNFLDKINELSIDQNRAASN